MLSAWASILLFYAMPLGAQTSVTFQYFYDDLGQLTKVVDSSDNVVEYVYDPVGNILRIKRTTVAPESLSIFAFTPQQGGFGQTVTIQGQGFSATPGATTVQFNGTAATVVSASANTVTALVPQGATTGPISVTVGTQTASSSNSFTAIPVPLITSLSRKSALFNATVPNVLVTGFNLSGATFAFQPDFSTPAITVTSTLIDPSGMSAALALRTNTQSGTFALVAKNSFGSSSSFMSKSNRFTVVDPRSTADSTGSGIPDAIKAAFGADPLDPNSIPLILPTPEAESLTVSIVNGVAPPRTSPQPMEADSLTLSLLNGVAPPAIAPRPLEADSLTVSVLNGITPPSAKTFNEADSLTLSLINGIATPVQPTVFEADSLTVSLANSAPKTGNQRPSTDVQFASLNRSQQNPHRGPTRRPSSAKPKPHRRTQSNEGD